MNNNTVSVEIFVDVDKCKNISDIEKQIMEKTKAAAKELLVKIFEAKEAKILKDKRLIKKTKVLRYLFTIFGPVRFYRYKVKDSFGKFFYALDRSIGLEANSSFSPKLADRAVYLSTMYPYRQAKDLLCHETDSSLDHRSLWRLIQKKGVKLRQQDIDEYESLYTHSRPVKSTEQAYESLVLEVDGTGISSKQGKGKWMEAKLAIIYTGKQLCSKNSKVSRYELTNKKIFASVDTWDNFGKMTSYSAQRHYNIKKAENVLLLSDGDPLIKRFHTDYMPGSIHQCDHYHLKKKLRQVYSQYPNVLEKFLSLIQKRKHEKLPYLIKMTKVNGLISEADEEMLTSYINSNMDSIWAVDRLRKKMPKELLRVGSGAVEKNVDIAIARRFKLRGMSWSKEGAANLLALRLLYLNGKDLSLAA
jgi:hypothetical protein